MADADENGCRLFGRVEWEEVDEPALLPRLASDIVTEERKRKAPLFVVKLVRSAQEGLKQLIMYKMVTKSP